MVQGNTEVMTMLNYNKRKNPFQGEEFVQVPSKIANGRNHDLSLE
jgi:hypothetical protein